MFDYTAYGLQIRSAFPLPTLLPGRGGEPDVAVRREALPAPPDEEWEGAAASGTTGRDAYYFVRDVGGVLARDGREILADSLPGPTEAGFHNFVTGIGLGLALHQRGVFSLHASAVAVDGGAVAFVGWKGMGKSTMAGALHLRGHPVVTDDVLALGREGDEVVVSPAFPSLKLWPESAEALGDDPEALPRLHPTAQKRARAVADGFQADSLPLRALYVLGIADDGGGFRIEPVPAREACVELLRHSFALRVLGEAAATPDLLAWSARLAPAVPVRRLVRERRLEALPDVVDRVEADLARLAAAPLAEAA